MGIVERGGNALDAAPEGGFVRQVGERHVTGPGGEVPILVYDCRIGEIETICGQGVAPEAATVSHFRGLGLDLVPATDLLPACVPGEFGAWLLPLRDHGPMSLDELLALALHYAEKDNRTSLG